ncbi:MAG: acyl carrier protein [Flavobacteriales bacterium]|nr:acyl carrier protein [Flavobacteriales bacterium]
MSVAIAEFIEVVKGLFADEELVEASTSFRELEEWSSMQALILIAAVDEHFGVTLPEKEFRKAITVEDLFRLTNSLIKNA